MPERSDVLGRGKSPDGSRARPPLRADDQVLPAGLLLPVQKVADQLVGHQEALGSEVPAALRAALHPSLGGELLQTGLQRGEVHEIVPAVLHAVDALGGAQAEHEVLAAPLPLGDKLRAVDDIAPVKDSVDVGVQIPDEGVAPAAEIGVGPGAEADIGPGEPVAEIVPGLEAGLGEVGDLILGVAGPGPGGPPSTDTGRPAGRRPAGPPPRPPGGQGVPSSTFRP